MTLTDLVRHPARTDDRATGPVAGSAPDAPAGKAGDARRPAGEGRAPRRRYARYVRDADALAVTSFVLGLLGLLVLNVVLGPTAIVMALIALARSTARRGRALLGLALGVADLVVLGLLVTGDGTVVSGLGG
ncbi:hypothetical protein [uncultured Streptomyces sp.]|uniref:hypothetical protein n=1 Tax=uncultured Streptomyces sp. TaxID=174707 RepID=UPI00263902E4|nr:hypothetical protein [uncultured Streptomyces sp.]